MSQVCKKIKVSGRVQGVFFRAFTQEIAQQLKITGWVKNEPDGSVLTVACGEGTQLELFIAALQSGPPAAQVTDLSVEILAVEHFTDFTILR